MKAGLLFVLLLALSGCSRDDRRDCVESERVVDPVLLAFLSQARSAHHVADQREESDVAAAIRALESITQGPTPPGSLPEVGEVLADTRARLAELLTRGGRFEEAEQELTRGLELARSPSYFRGHLFEVRGLLEERREKDLRAKGLELEANRARERSLAAYEEAMKLQAQVIRGAVETAPSSTGPHR